MRKFILPILILACSTKASADDWNLRASVDVDLSSWDDSLGDEGLQIASIASLAAANDSWRFGVSTGYIWARANSDIPEFDGSVSTPMDTVVSASFRGLKTRISGRELRLSLDGDVSLPTGQSQLTGRERNVVFDPLLARFDRYGEGFNYSGGLLAALAVTDRISVAGGVRFTGTGKYRPNGDAPDVEINPGDTTSFLGQLVWRFRDRFISLGVQVLDEAVARRNDVRLLDRGRRLELSAAGATTIGKNWKVNGSAFYTTRRRDRRLDELSGEFRLEDSRRDGNVWAAAASLYRQFAPSTALGVEGDFASIGDGEIDDADFSYLPARRRWRIGVGVRHRMPARINLSAAVRYIHYRDRGSQLLLPLEAEGLNFTLGLSTDF